MNNVSGNELLFIFKILVCLRKQEEIKEYLKEILDLLFYISIFSGGDTQNEKTNPGKGSLLEAKNEISGGRLYYFGARYLDPQTSRWMSADPIYDGLKEGFGLYTYCRNNPLIYHDPSGLEAKDYDGTNYYKAPTSDNKGNWTYGRGKGTKFIPPTTFKSKEEFKGQGGEFGGGGASGDIKRSEDNLNENKNNNKNDNQSLNDKIINLALQSELEQKKINPKEEWHKGTFPTVDDSMEYHLDRHGKGRSLEKYTMDAKKFYIKNKDLGEKLILKDGTSGIKIQTGSGKYKIGGFWTENGKIVSFWD